MKEFRTSLMREKFTITDLEAADPDLAEPIIALSNRIEVPLRSEDGIDSETFIVRTQNMHSCTRAAAAIVKEFLEIGSLANRPDGFNWERLWNDVVKGYEKEWNPNIWCAIYYKGKLVFEDGDHHAFLDIIEKCDAANEGDYAQSVLFAETAFKQAGKTVKIDHDSNIALVMAIEEAKAKCGVIIRSATGTTTFNYTSEKKPNGRALPVQTVLTSAASFLEGVQLAFQVGLMKKKEEVGLIEPYSDDQKKLRRSTDRLGNLNRAINSFDSSFNVNYRPDRPNFSEMVNKAEDFALKILAPQIQEKIDSGELNEKDWIV
ncbi:MAG: hypothetical protein AAF988_03490 [Pseudomonadota bacterium]